MLWSSPRRWLPVSAVLIGALALAGCGGDDDDSLTVTNQAGNRSAARSLEPTPAPPSVATSPSADAAGSVTFAGVTVGSALDTAADPALTSTSATPAPGLLVQDLIVGTGAEATPTSEATLHYKGVLYADGTEFDQNYTTEKPEPRALGKAVAGFAQGVGGTDGVDPMRVGGRRLMIFPAALGYGAVPVGEIPAHASLVFVVDLLDLP